jgi:hypothetical protein
VTDEAHAITPFYAIASRVHSRLPVRSGVVGSGRTGGCICKVSRYLATNKANGHSKISFLIEAAVPVRIPPFRPASRSYSKQACLTAVLYDLARYLRELCVCASFKIGLASGGWLRGW